MRSYKITVSILILFVSAGNVFSLPDFYDRRDPQEVAVEILDSMDKTALLGQVFLLGYYGLDPSDDILEWIRDKKIGGVKIFGWNVSDLARLGRSISAMQAEAEKTPFRIPLFIATDQEGGWVRHIKGDTSVTSGNMSIGATGFPEDAYRSGYYIARELNTLGVNMNFAPTVDIYTNPDADVIGPRSFSSDPEKTASLSVSFYQGQDSAGIISTAKHFPGHGATAGDSHGMLPTVNADYKTVWGRELLPYRFLIKRNIPAIMSGHLAYPDITGDSIPASRSSFFLTDILRNSLGFRGIIITDDMVMTGALDGTDSIENACLEALEAGNDIIMISRTTRTYEKVWDYLYKEIESKPEFERKIRDSVKRILLTKLKYLRENPSANLHPDIEKIVEDIPDREGESFFFDLAFRSVSIVRQEEIPLELKSSEKILFAAPYRVFLDEGLRRLPEADSYYFPFAPGDEETGKWYSEDFKNTAENYDRIIFCLANRYGQDVLETMEESDTPVTVISTLTPVYLRDLPWVTDAVAVYGSGYESFRAGIAAVLGDFTPTGKVPVDFGGNDN